MLGKRIRILRERKGISQEELGKRLGVRKQTISNWENGNITPSLDKLEALVEFFHTTPNHLMGYDEERCYLDVTGLTENEILHLQVFIGDLKELHKRAEQAK